MAVPLVTTQSLISISLTRDGLDVSPAPEEQTHPNAISTGQYTLLTWLPKSLYMQFQRVANVYFLVIAILACTPAWNGKWYAQVMVVVSILLVQALKDLYEDARRWRDDWLENTKHCLSYTPSVGTSGELEWDESEWWDCSVGDLLLLRSGEFCPADVLVVATAGRSNICYVSTKSLDGETNLKQRQAPALVQQMLGNVTIAEDMSLLLGVGLQIQVEQPHASLEEINGFMIVGGRQAGVSQDNFVLRGCKLENTEWMIGVACYVGNCTKVRLNATETPSKMSELERMLNFCVVLDVSFLVLLCTYFALASLIDSDGPSFIVVWVRYFVGMYNTLPASLYIYFEFCHVLFGKQIDCDQAMVDEDTETNAKARNTAVLEELGQVNFVFSDKTGTLTANEMRFAQCCVDRTVLGSFLPDATGAPGQGWAFAQQMLQNPAQAKSLRSFFELLALCHTVKLAKDGGLQGESPDEVALVEAARTVGFNLVAQQLTDTGTIQSLQGPWGTQEHRLAHELAFTSDRKRMSGIFPTADGGALVLCKGADSIMEGLLASPLPPEARRSLVEFSRAGLRTLVLAQRQLSSGEYTSWKAQWDRANAAVQQRAQQIAQVSAIVEQGMSYIGITALEDQLQTDVPETIANLREAGVRVWVLTGDKVETATEIARSCRLFDDQMQFVRLVDEPSADACLQKLLSGMQVPLYGLSRGIILDGRSVQHILEDTRACQALYRLAAESSSCVCCRLSPLQKRRLVELVRTQNDKAITVSIGDGANDVPMIQGAHVGVGIRGKEGAASVQASDFAISEFRFLANLLFCHGRRAYRRLSVYLCYFIYKSIVLGWAFIIDAHAILFEGERPFSQIMLDMYIPFSTISPMLLLILEYDVSEEEAVDSPFLYWPGQDRAYFNPRVFLTWMGYSFWHGTLAWCVPVYTMSSHQDRLDKTLTFSMASYTSYCVVIVVVHVKLLIVMSRTVTKFGFIMMILEVIWFFVCTWLLGMDFARSFTEKLSPEFTGVPAAALSSRSHWFCLLGTVAAALSLDILVILFCRGGDGVTKVRALSDEADFEDEEDDEDEEEE